MRAGLGCSRRWIIAMPIALAFMRSRLATASRLCSRSPRASRRSSAPPTPMPARGLALRMDNGTQYTADDFLNQVKFWGIAPSFAFVAEPQTNSVAERFNRTLKEQAIHGRIFTNVEEVRAAVTAFKDRYNRHWRLEKLGFMSHLEARPAHGMPCHAMRKAA